MMIAIAILAGLAYIFSIIEYATKEKLSVNLLVAAILVISTWECLPLAITVMAITALIAILGAFINKK